MRFRRAALLERTGHSPSKAMLSGFSSALSSQMARALVGPVVNPFNTSRFDFIGLNGMLPMVHCRPALFCLDVAFFELVPAQGAGLDEAGDFASVANTGYDRYGGQTGGLGEEAGVSDGPVRVALVGGP